MPIYLALTSLNPRDSGWRIVATGAYADQTEQEAQAAIERLYGPLHEYTYPNGTTRTALLNLRVLSETAARKLVGSSRLDQLWDEHLADQRAQVADPAGFWRPIG